MITGLNAKLKTLGLNLDMKSKTGENITAYTTDSGLCGSLCNRDLLPSCVVMYNNSTNLGANIFSFYIT